VARTEFVVALGQRILDPKNQIYTANTFSRAVQNGLSTINVIVETITSLPDNAIWGYMYSQYQSEFEALNAGLTAMCTKPFIGYADNSEKLHFSAERMPYLSSICILIMKDVFKSTTIPGRKRKASAVVWDHVVEIVNG
jgi:hypothetical protein